MGNKRNRRSRRLGTPSPERSLTEVQIETPSQSNDTLGNVDSNIQGDLDNFELRSQLIEPSQLSNEIQAWTENFEQKNNDRNTKMREEMENKLDAILKEIKSNKSASTVTNPRSEMNEIQIMQPSGSPTNKSTGVHASYNEHIDSEDEDYSLQASEMRDLRHPAKPFHKSETNLDRTIISDEDSEVEDYHMVTGANRQLHRQSSHNPHSLNDTIGSHADRQTSTMTETPSDPVNQIAQAIEKLANKNPQQSLFHPKNTLTFKGKNDKNGKFEDFEDLFHAMLRMKPNLTEEMKINHFHAHLRGLALKTFKNIQRTPSTTPEDILKVFRRKFVKPESSASAKHRFNRLFLIPKTKNYRNTMHIG